jgi:predicted permease
MLDDLRFALRVLWKSPGFTLAAALSLALGIGANATIFSFIDGLWFRPPAVHPAGALVRLFHVTERSPFGTFSWPDYTHFRDNAASFASLVAVGRRGGFYRSEAGQELISVNVVSPNFFTDLGIPAAAGRVFRSQDDPTATVAVLGFGFWQRRFGGDPRVVGSTIRLTRGAVTVIGVLTKEFREIDAASEVDLWLPPQSWVAAAEGGNWEEFELRGRRWMEILGVLRPGVARERADQEVQLLASRLAREFPKECRGMRAAVWSDLDYRLHLAGLTGAALAAIVILVVLISCVNVANLLMARAESRRKEIAMRLALGAGRWRIVRQLLVESLLLALAGAGVALLLAGWLIDLLPSLIRTGGPEEALPIFRLDLRVLGFLIGLSLLTGVLFGLAPALQSVRGELVGALKGERYRLLPRRVTLRDAAAVAQAALSLFLVAGAGLLVRSFVNVRTNHLGFERKNLLVVSLGAPFDGPKASLIQEEAFDRVRRLPGVRRAGYATRAPLTGPGSGIFQRVTIPGYELPPGVSHLEIRFNRISPGFFETLGTRLLRGRDFQPSDSPSAPRVAVINESMARRFWPGEDPLGKLFLTGTNVPWQVIGIVEDSPNAAIGELPQPYFYVPIAQMPHWEFTLLLETTGDPLGLATAVRGELRSLDQRLDPWTVTTFESLLRRATLRYRMTASLVGGLGLLGLLLTGVGLYGVILFGVNSRLREIGIRMALGAERGRTMRLVLRRGTRVGLAGVLIGLPLSLAAVRIIPWLLHDVTPYGYSILFGVSPYDPGVFVTASAVILGVAAAASLWPARRASTVNPVHVLREE